MKPRVVYWNTLPSPYMVDRFNALADRGALDFEAWFSSRTHDERSWRIDESRFRFPYRYLPRGLAVPLLRRRTPDLLVLLYGSAPLAAGFLLARARGVRTAFWAEVTFESWFPRRAWKELLKRRLYAHVDGVITVGEDGRRLALGYGAPADRVTFAPHAVDAAGIAARAAAARADRERLRAQLGARGTTFLYVGRLWKGKGVDVLLDAYRKVASATEASLLLAGDGPEEEGLRRRVADEGIANVSFLGFRQQEELAPVHAAADVFVFPTLGDPYGLVVDEAMAASLPVISSSAVGELALRIDDGETGLVVPANHAGVLAERMLALARDGELRARIAAAGAARVASSSPERWAADFERAVEHILALPRARPHVRPRTVDHAP